jgi:hypothetical protein
MLHVYRLAAIDPEPVVKTLEDMGNLEPHTTLTVDEANRAIIVTASEADHEKILKLLEKLDGSTREFYVRHLRRLAAEDVAGTIEFMLGAGEKEEKGYDRYSYYPYTNRMRPDPKEDKDQLRVDADIEYNRLLLWATDVEMQEVENLLVKLGEIPAEGGSPDTLRVLDTGGGEELEALIERIRRTWTAPNQLIVIPPEESEETKSQEQTRESAPASKDATTQTATRRLFRFAQLSREDAGSEASQDAEEGDTGKKEISPAPAEPDAGSEVAPDAGKGAPGAVPLPDPGKSSPAADPGKSAAKPPPPVRISWGPDGRVMIASEDPKILDALEDMLNRYAPPRRNYKVYDLKYAVAYWVAQNLEDFFEEEEEGSGRNRYYDPWWGYRYGGSTNDEGGARLSKRRPVKFISDDDTNTILVQNADSVQLKTIADLIRLYDQPEPADALTVRKTEIILLHYTKAEVVEKALKDVYRDLLSSNDKALREGQQQKAERSYTYNFGDGGTTMKLPRWKGQLSIGVDALSNSLIVSAPTYLFEDVMGKIKELDQAAKPVSTIRVLKVDGRLSAAGLQEKLGNLIGGGSRRPSGGKPSSAPKPPKSSSPNGSRSPSSSSSQ